MTKNNSISFVNWLQSGLVRTCRVHFVLISVYAIYIIAADATKLTEPKLVLQRWTMNTLLLIGVVTVWFLAKSSIKTSGYYKALFSIVILLDIAMATFNVYTERGMASRAVILYCISIVVSALLLSRTALFLTATLCTAAYSLAAVKYFVDYFNEGYKAELYIEVAFYIATFFILAAILSILIRFNNGGAKLNS